MTQDEVGKMMKRLVGEHLLTAVAYGKDGNGVFKLDGVTFEAVEDPDDGYRSYMDELKIANAIPDMYEIPVLVSLDDEGDHNIIEMRDRRNGKTVLIVGTEDVTDYYPCYVFDYQPKNIFENQ